jgi:uncharacterized NAD(P)/FAD-binding protein YdhS
VTRDELVTALRGILGPSHAGTRTEGRVLDLIDTHVLTAVREAEEEALKAATREQHENAWRVVLQELWDAEKPRLMAEVEAVTEDRLQQTMGRVIAAERKRIRRLAVEHFATYDERSPCDCGRVDCTALVRSRVPFADLITEPPTEGTS